MKKRRIFVLISVIIIIVVFTLCYLGMIKFSTAIGLSLLTCYGAYFLS